MRYVTPRQAADRYRVSERTIRREIVEGRIEAVRVRGQYRIPEEALARYERTFARVVPPTGGGM